MDPMAKKTARTTSDEAPQGGALTHLDARGNARMVSVADKDVTTRQAVARARVTADVKTLALARRGDSKKGDVAQIARIAGISAAKQTAFLIPLCHPIALTRTAVEVTIGKDAFEIVATCEARDRTGVEMEALTAASVAALTVYDMLKAVDRGMTITVGLDHKSGGRSGTWNRDR